MCLSIPGEIVSINNLEAVATIGNVKRSVRLDLLPSTKVGDFVLIHSGYALEKIDDDEAQATLDMLHDMQEKGSAFL